MTDDDLDTVRSGNTGRLVIVLAVVAAAALAIWWLWPEHGRGEREQAHRVLVVGGTPTDLIEPIVEAGFEAEQLTWADAEHTVTALEGRFDVDALIGYADEQGYGFVAVMFGDDYPWTPTLLGSEAPAEASAAVISIGELAQDWQPQVRFGGPPAVLRYDAGHARAEGLRLALYEHPDLVRLWDDPSPEQMQQQVHLGQLGDARTLLAKAVTAYEEAAAAWPSDELPEDAATQPWTSVRGFPIPGGLIVERRAQQLHVDERRRVRVETGRRETSYVDRGALERGEGLAGAKPIELPAISYGALSRDLRWLVAESVENGAVHRYALGPGTIEDRGELEVFMGERFEVSTEGKIAWTTGFGVESEIGVLEFMRVRLDDYSWHAPDVIALALFDPGATIEGEGLAALLFARPQPRVDAPGPDDAGDEQAPGLPALLTLDAAELVANGDDVSVEALVPSAVGTFVVIEHDSEQGGPVESLIRVALPAAALRVPVRASEGTDAGPEPDTELDPGTIDSAAIRAGLRPLAELRELDGFAHEELGIIPPFEQLAVAPDGSWVAWRAVGSRGSTYAARVSDGQLAAPVRLAELGPTAGLWDDGPRFWADSAALAFMGTQPWEFGVIEFVRAVARPD